MVYVFLNVEIKPSVYTRGGEYHVWLRHCQILRHAVPWSSLLKCLHSEWGDCVAADIGGVLLIYIGQSNVLDFRCA